MRKIIQQLFVVLLVGSSLFFTSAAFATNGMNLEGYGPIATGMGGASMAYDNGAAAVMNNPATLGLMPQGDRLDTALGYLGPHVTAKCTAGPCAGAEAESSADAFFMPALGWIRKTGLLSFGVGLFSQGGMGTEFEADSFMAAGSSDKVRSEVGVGRVLFPLAYEINKNFSIGGSLDFVWASMDLKMALTGDQFLNMAGMGAPSTMQQRFGTASGSMLTAFGSAVSFGIISNGMPGNPSPVNWGRFDFSDDGDFTGTAKGNGFGAKLGGVYRASDKLSFGMAYHSKTDISDLETNDASVTFNANVDDNILNGTWNPGVSGAPAGTYSATAIPVKGKITIKDFQWPQMIGAGMAYQATSKLLVVFDYKWINWSDAMKDFKMTFTADSSQAGMAGSFGSTVLDATMYQNWKNQHVFMIGAGYKVTPGFTARIGANIANNPSPDTYLNPLFPATIKNHYMIGSGYVISTASSIDASFTYAPTVENTNGQGVKIEHNQTNAQVMYSYLF